MSLLLNKFSQLVHLSAIDDGDIATVAQQVLQTLVTSLHLQDASIWLAMPNGGMRCSFYLDLHKQTQPAYGAINLEQATFFDQQLVEQPTPEQMSPEQSSPQQKSGEQLYQSYSYAKPAQWLPELDLSGFVATAIGIRLKGQLVGFILCKRQAHLKALDTDAILFICSASALLGRTILSAQSNQALQSLNLANTELEHKIFKRNQKLKETLENLQASQDYQVEVEKMEALGQLVCGVAHEVNTPLGVAITSLSIIGQQIDSLAKAYESESLDENTFIQFLEQAKPAFEMTQSNLDRAAKLVQDFKQTSAAQSHTVTDRFNLKQTVSSVITSIEPIYQPYKVEFVLDIPEKIEVTTYIGAIDQILTNLINNSCIHGFEPSKQPENLIYIKVFEMENAFMIDYQDNGVGIADEVAKQIFTPFYTTNRSKGGTGLGLSVIYNLVTQKLKGDIRVVEQQASFGAHFQIRLPLAVS